MDSQRLTANRKRSKRLTYLKRKNMNLAIDIKRYMGKNPLMKDNSSLVGLLQNLHKCASNTLYAADYDKIRLIAPLTCKHKLCNICNWNRQKSIRRKYMRWFENNKMLCRISKGKNIKYCTQAQLESFLNKNFKVLSENIEYDLMHLTLTVPHTVGGWRGSDIYIDEIIKTFHDMRRLKWWSDFVYGGEYGVETTKNDSGFHTHIHSLLMVKKRTNSRNLLHYEIFREWNRLTVNSESERLEFTDYQIQKILKGNKLFTEDYVKALNPKGATLIGLNCIYTTKNQGNQFVKVYTSEWGSEAMMRGVMETISYHFKPRTFHKGESDTNFDVARIIEMLPKVQGKILYRRFGVLEKESVLSIKGNSEEQDYRETSEECDEETGEVLESKYFSTNPLNMYAKGENNEITLSNRVDGRIIELKARSGLEAIKELNQLVNKK